MSKFKFVHKHEVNNTEIEISFEAVSMEDIIEQLRSFLLACGFSEKIIDKYIDLE